MKTKNGFSGNSNQWIVIFLMVVASAGARVAKSSEGGNLSAEQIIQKVDEIRNPADSYRMKIEVRSSEEEIPSTFDVMIQGNTKTLIKTLAPVRDRGRNLLMLNEEMWAYIPNLKRSVRVSLAQKLSGQAANGDISRMRWSGDYSAVIEKTEKGVWILLLTAKKKGLTYEKVRVWVEQSTFYPKKSEFLTAAGKPLKGATYQDFKMMAGKVRPTQLLIQDAIRFQDRSTLKILSMEIREFPGSTFNQNNMN